MSQQTKIKEAEYLLEEQLLEAHKNLPISTQLLQQKRKNALEKFSLIKLPSAKSEEYKYTPIRKFLQKEFSQGIKSTSSQLEKPHWNKLGNEFKANILVFINGNFKKDYSTILEDSNTLEISSFQEAEQKKSAILAKLDQKETQDPFFYLNTMLFQEGTIIHVPKNKTTKYPIVLHFIEDTTHSKIFSNTRNLLSLGENSQTKLIEWYEINGQHTSFTNYTCEIFLENQALLDYYKIQLGASGMNQVNTTIVTQHTKSVFNSYTVTIGGGIMRNNLNTNLDESHCEANLYGLYLLKGATHIDNHTSVDHKKPHTFSNELYKGILEDKATGVFNGKVFVQPQAQKTNAFQANNNILLSDESTINAKPQLEIWADDVKCSHGCTIGQLDQEQLFYLRARGISLKNAKMLLLKGFVQEITEKIKIDALKNYLIEVLEKELINE